jgi:4'-phosphopantetheinyl transferase
MSAQEAPSVARTLLSQDPALICAQDSALHAAPRSVHVWAFDLKASPACLEQCRRTLSSVELARAARFVHAAGGDDFVVAHGVLRHLLGRYTDRAASELKLSLGARGKPALDGAGRAGDAISFNLSHSHGRALIAVSDGRAVGIDLEKIKPGVKALAIARRYFARAELAAIEAAPAPLQASTFFRYWVAKEALLKGDGIGLRFPIDEFELQFDSHDLTARIHTRNSSRLADDWQVQILPVEAAWAAALAVRGPNWTLRLENSQDLSEQRGAH